MSLPRYLQYKESGAPWLGQVPVDWDVTPLKSCFAIYGGSTPKSDETSYWEGDIIWVSPADLSKLASFYIEDSARKISEAGLKSCGATLVPEGSIVLSTRAPIGSLAIATTELCTNQGCKSLIPGEGIQSLFYAYFLSVATEALNVRGKGTTFLELSADELGAFRVPRPSFSEQIAISAFLTHETRKIDALIIEQEKLLTLLAEKRQATISHAVTRGLNPDAPLKDSGVAWLGEVPAHWDVFPIKRDLTFLTSGSRGWAEHYADDGALFLRIGNLTRDSVNLDLTDIQRVEVPKGTEGQRTRVQSGDLLFSITAYLGSVAVVPENLEPAFVSQHIALVRLRKEKVLPLWVAYLSLSWVGKTYLATQGYGGTKVQLSLDDVACLLTTAPPLEEQRTILKFLEREVVKVDALAAKAERAIDLLRERRSAMVAAAVTGKIDVCEQPAALDAAA
ncbi:restriction endonuclease subunit S [Caballeronia sp. dw_276]|uniref:restriction endonuclease subunit S n=1 Tax=Caballeronia sp. dw_276 TaxID=2719795 RepID=UPI001BD54C14|nr:restriction endonuclease subunit S [Caballeronia sp. dw_276]